MPSVFDLGRSSLISVSRDANLRRRALGVPICRGERQRALRANYNALSRLFLCTAGITADYFVMRTIARDWRRLTSESRS